MDILGISYGYHDSAASLIRNGSVVAAIQEERLSRIKSDKSFPYNSIKFCLADANLHLSDLDAVVFYEKPLLKLERILDGYYFSPNSSRRHFINTISSLTHKIYFKRDLIECLRGIDQKFNPDRLLFGEHHLSHAASAFYPSPFQEATVITLDGVGESATTTIGLGCDSELKILKEIHFPHSLGLFYSTLTSFCGFKVNSGEYKLMGLAPYGRAKFENEILDHLICLNGDGSFNLNEDYFNFFDTKRMYSDRLAHFFQIEPRLPEQELLEIHFDIAASTQAVLNRAVVNLVNQALRETGVKNLCLAGGVALNCVTNSEILKKTPVERLWIQPAAGDAGASLGAALSAHHLHFKNARILNQPDNMSGAQLGSSYTDEQIRKCLLESGLSFVECASDKMLFEKTALCLEEGLSVGWFQGRMEFGPRALGSRSILADARHSNMQKKLNLQIKFRESFRPFAPVVLEEEANGWFDMRTSDSPYMLMTFNVRSRDAMGQQIPAVTHVDQSARVQTVSRSTNPHLYSLLKEFFNRTSCPVLINTSFNVRGEPIVESPQDAIRCFTETHLDVLALGRFLVTKEQNPQVVISEQPSQFKFD